jgi:predicted dehydrogenase
MSEGMSHYFQSQKDGGDVLKVAIVGCGKIADAHSSQIQRIKRCDIVGVCDKEPLMARQLSESFPETFASQIRPPLHQLRIHGKKNGLILDQDNETLIKLLGTAFKSYAETFIAPVIMAYQYLRNLITHLCAFLARDFHMKSGMKYLIESFYRSIVDGTPVPIPYREILLTARIMDGIFAQLNLKRPQIQTEDETLLHGLRIN